MAKDWMLVGSNALEFGDTRMGAEKRRDGYAADHRFGKAIRNEKSLSYAKLVAKAEKSYAEKLADDAALLEAFKDKKVKSKAAIKRAKALIKKQKAAVAPAAE